jgi:hypothetical protein
MGAMQQAPAGAQGVDLFRRGPGVQDAPVFAA